MGDSKDGRLLDSPRVLDVTDEKGYLCGKMLADLGADVIKIEKPGGDSGRRLGPFYHDIPDSEKSLYWFAYNANKRGITLNLDTSDGKELFKRLVNTADFVIESFRPGYLDEIGLGYSVLSQINPRIILASITPFGQSGPYRDYKGSDIVAMAMGGLMYLQGDPDRPPVRISFPNAYNSACGDATVATLIAHHHREATGEGQWIDVSAQDSILVSAIFVIPVWDYSREILKRAGDAQVGLAAGIQTRVIWPCEDGFVCFRLRGGADGRKVNSLLTEWMASEGKADSFIREVDWSTFDLNTISQGTLDRIQESIAKFFTTHTKAELYRQAIEKRIFLYPVSTVKDILEDPQLKARDFWVTLEHPELDTSLVYPGAFGKATEAPLQVKRRAPLIGEHNGEIYIQELGLSRDELITLKQAGII